MAYAEALEVWVAFCECKWATRNLVGERITERPQCNKITSMVSNN